MSALSGWGTIVRSVMLLCAGAIGGAALLDQFNGTGLGRLVSICAGTLVGLFVGIWLPAVAKVAADFLDRILPNFDDIRLAYEVAAQVRRGDVHPIVGREVVALLLISDRPMAVVRAFRSVEIRLRDLVAPDSRLGGAELIQKAFSPGDGLFADSGRPHNEQEATMNLFKCGFTLHRNLAVHHDFTPTRGETLVKIWSASQLHQVLDEVEKRHARQRAPR